MLSSCTHSSVELWTAQTVARKRMFDTVRLPARLVPRHGSRRTAPSFRSVLRVKSVTMSPRFPLRGALPPSVVKHESWHNARALTRMIVMDLTMPVLDPIMATRLILLTAVVRKPAIPAATPRDG